MFFTYWDDLGTTPARVNRYTGEIQINSRCFRKMPQFRRDFIIEHEKGHFNLDTRSEFEADKYAFKNMAGSAPRSLKESVYSISRVLSFRNPEHLERMTEVVKMALDHDYRHNGNDNAKTALNELNTIIENNKLTNFYMNNSDEKSYFEPKFGVSEHEDIYDNAKGKAKRKARKASRVTKRQNKRQTRVAAKVARKQTRVAGRVARKQTRVAGRVANRAIRNTEEPVDENIMEQEEMISSEEQYPDESYSEPVETDIMDESSEMDQDTQEEYPEEEMESYFGEDGEILNPSYYDGDDVFDNGGGKARRTARRALRDEKKKAKIDVIKSRADSKRTKAEGKLELAKQGKSGTDWIGSAVGGIASIFGGKKSSADDAPLDNGSSAPPEATPSDKILGMPKGVAIAVIAVVVLIIIGVVFFVLKKKKS